MSCLPSTELVVGERRLGLPHPTFFIADIAANHDGDLARAKDLIHQAAEAGADAAKFQHFQAATIVSDYGFRRLGTQRSHQAAWGKSVFDVYAEASVPLDWTHVLHETCARAKIAFMTSPYSLELVDVVDEYMPAYKIGSGDITWREIVTHIARKGKPVFLATGASEMPEVRAAVEWVLAKTPNLALMQCNTNYTAAPENLRHVQLNVLKTYAAAFPGMILGLSDHTPGCASVLGAVALGARVVEKHFTDDRARTGPDHGFSMTPGHWQEMVRRVRELEASLGDGVKRVEENERETVVLQRRALRARLPLPSGVVLTRDRLIPLRPCPSDGIPPYRLGEVLGRKIRRDIEQGDLVRWSDLE